MNRQVGYIAYAYAMVAGIALSCFVISKIPFSTVEEKSNESLSGSASIPSKTKNLSELAYKGKLVFQSKCASCHSLVRDMTGPRLSDAMQKEPWTDRKELYKWIRNPEAYMKASAYARSLKEKYGAMMTAFPNITDEEIDAIIAYVNSYSETVVN